MRRIGQTATTRKRDLICCLLESCSPLDGRLRLPGGSQLYQRLKPFRQLAVKVLAFVIDNNEGREVFHVNAPNGLHAEVFVFQHLDVLDTVFGQPGGGSADGAEVESAVGPQAWLTCAERFPLASMTMLPPRL